MYNDNLKNVKSTLNKHKEKAADFYGLYVPY